MDDQKPAPATREVAVPAGIISLRQISGSDVDAFSNVLANQAINTVLYQQPGTSHDDKQTGAVLAVMKGVAPRDELEGMLAAQIVGLHNAAMEAMRRAMLRDLSLEVYREYLNQANKLTRSYAVLLDALTRYRGKGQQKVTVEHVHVHSGGQAIVGNVSRPEGVERKNEEQPHAPMPTMPSPDTKRQPMPVSSNA